MCNSFLELASSPLMNLDHTYRYSGTKLLESESLSQHIVDTIMMGLKIIDKVNSLSGSKILDPSAYVMKAVYHDLEEVITGDIPRPLKYYNEATKDSLKDVADKVATELFSSQFEDGYSHYEIWRDSKEGNEGYILKIVDTLVVANKVVKEVVLLNNFYFLRVAHEVSSYLHELHDNLYFSESLSPKAIEYIFDVLEGAISVMEEIIDDHKDCMDSLNIYGQSMI